jgi:hypothetical protein
LEQLNVYREVKGLKRMIAKYENWIKSIRSSVDKLNTILTQEWKIKLNIEDIVEIINKASELLIQLKETPTLQTEDNLMKWKSMRVILEANRREIEGYKATIEELINQKNELEVYNSKANEEIISLVNRLKLEQTRQRQLSEDLITIKEGIKA